MQKKKRQGGCQEESAIDEKISGKISEAKGGFTRGSTNWLNLTRGIMTMQSKVSNRGQTRHIEEHWREHEEENRADKLIEWQNMFQEYYNRIGTTLLISSRYSPHLRWYYIANDRHR